MGVLGRFATRQKDKEKEQLRSERNYSNEPKEVVWYKDWGVLIPHCPSCDEPAYEHNRCVFCGQPYIKTEKPIKDTIVKYEEYTAIKVGGADCINVLKNGVLITHCDLEEGAVISEEYLLNMLKRIKEKK